MMDALIFFIAGSMFTLYVLLIFTFMSEISSSTQKVNNYPPVIPTIVTYELYDRSGRIREPVSHLPVGRKIVNSQTLGN